jgi:dipeptidase
MKSRSLVPVRYVAFLVILLGCVGSFSAWLPASGVEEPDSCTSIMVGRLASTDGSIITCHTCDGNYRTWLNIVPHQKHQANSKNKVYWGNLHTETPWDMRGKILKGEIPEVEETYAFLNVAYPALNEKQLGIGETTIGGRQELENDEGLFLIEELERIALERCTTARDAIRLIGNLVKEYGYGDSGECITIADKKEVWHFEIFGAGPAEKGAVWAAVRIPDDYVGVSANRPRISELKLDDPDRYMASENVFKVAEDMGWWKKGEPFKFWKAYSGRPPFSDREYFIFNTLAPELKLRKDAEELPFSVKPSKKLSVRDVMKMYRETYEGTDDDMTRNLMVPKPRRRGDPEPAKDAKPEMVKSPIASGWMSNDLITLLNTLKPGTVERKRTIAIAACSYSQIVQIRPWLPDEIGGIAWFSFDNPAQSPRFPIFSGTLSLPKSFEMDGQHRFTPDAAIWSFRMANRLAALNWGESRKLIEEGVAEFENRAFQELPAVEKIALDLSKEGDCRPYLTKYTNDFARAEMEKWSELATTLWPTLARPY